MHGKHRATVLAGVLFARRYGISPLFVRRYSTLGAVRTPAAVHRIWLCNILQCHRHFIVT